MRAIHLPLACALCFAAHSFAALTFTSVTKTEGGPLMPGQPAGGDMTSTVSIDGDRLRMETGGGPLPANMQSYFLTKDGGQTMYMVNAADKTYMQWDVEKMLSGGMQAATGMMKLTYRNVKVDKLLEEKGPEIQGYPTTHIKLRTAFETEMNLFGKSQVNKTVQEEETWATTKISGDTLRKLTDKQAPGLGDPEFAKLLRQQQELIKGLPLRRVVTATQTDASGKQQVTKTTTEITAIKEGGVAPAVFEIPADYQLIQLPAFGASPFAAPPAADPGAVPPGRKPATR